jgi:hypothetical protein
VIQEKHCPGDCGLLTSLIAFIHAITAQNSIEALQTLRGSMKPLPLSAPLSWRHRTDKCDSILSASDRS